MCELFLTHACIQVGGGQFHCFNYISEPGFMIFILLLGKALSGGLDFNESQP